jgi:hypothetical protein
MTGSRILLKAGLAAIDATLTRMTMELMTPVTATKIVAGMMGVGQATMVLEQEAVLRSKFAGA